jgi:hypothetical protein
MMKNIGKAIKTRYGYEFVKEFWEQGHIYKFMGDLNKVSDDYPIYSAEYQDNRYETKSSLKKMCEGSKVNWKLLFDLLDWQHAETLFYELDESDWFFGGFVKK